MRCRDSFELRPRSRSQTISNNDGCLFSLDDGIGRLIFDAALAVFGHPTLNAHKAIFTPLRSPGVLNLSDDDKQKKQSKQGVS